MHIYIYISHMGNDFQTPIPNHQNGVPITNQLHVHDVHMLISTSDEVGM